MVILMIDKRNISRKYQSIEERKANAFNDNYNPKDEIKVEPIIIDNDKVEKQGN